MALYFSKEEANELKANVSFPKILDYLGIPTKKVGKQICMLCPDPKHNDRHYGSCVVKENGAYCYACGTFTNASKLLIDFEGYKPYEAFTVMADVMGVSALYEQKGKTLKEIEQERKERARAPKFLYDHEEAKFLGLVPSEHAGVTLKHWARPVKYSFLPFEVEKGHELHKEVQDDGWILYTETEKEGALIRDFEKEDPEAFRYIMQQKAKERMFDAIFTYELLKNPKQAPKILNNVRPLINEHMEGILKGLINVYEQAKDILIKYGGTAPSTKELVAEFIIRNEFAKMP